MSDSSNLSFLEPVQRACTSVRLPSKGVLYGGELSKGVVELAPMTMAEETYLSAGSRKKNILPVIDEVLRRCIVEPKHINIRDLISSDKFFLLIMLRAVTFGSEYTFTWVCPNLLFDDGKPEPCKHSNKQKVHIPEDFKIKYLDKEDKEPYIVRLPESGREVGIRLLRGRDEATIDEFEESLPKDDRHKSTVFSMARHIVMVDGNKITSEVPMDKLMLFVSSLPARDVGAIRDTIEFYTPGIDTSVRVKCAECGYEEEMDIPLSADFFRAEPTCPGRPDDVQIRSDVLPTPEQPGDNAHAPGRAGVAAPEISRDEKGGAGS